MAEIILPPEEETPETPQTPELNIDKPTENSKVITIEFEAKKTNKVSTKDTNQQLYTTDTDAWFEFKETSLEGANGTYSVVFRNRHDGSIFQRTGDVVNGVAYYKIPHQEIRHAGAWRGQIVYTLSNGDTTAREFGYDVKGHILDGKDVREIVVEDFETLMSQLRSMKDNAEVELAHLTQELRNTTDTAEQNETDRQAFFVDLVEDIDELQTNYQELLDTGVLQTNINTKLEALEEEYAPKLTEVTAQLAQTVDEVNRAASELTHDSEVILARGSGVKGKEFGSLDERLEENEEDLAQHKIEYAEEISKKANKQQEDWIRPTILNGWVDAIDSSVLHPTSFMKDEFGFVHIRGHMSGGEDPVMFLLPEDYRPSHHMHFAVVNNHASGGHFNGIVVARSGTVRVNSMDSPLRPSLNVSFKAVES